MKIFAILLISLQVLMLTCPNPFKGAGVLGIALLPLVAVWYLAFPALSIAGIIIGMLTLKLNWRAVLGYLLILVSIANGVQVVRGVRDFTNEGSNQRAEDAKNIQILASLCDPNFVRVYYLAQEIQKAPLKIVSIYGETINLEKNFKIEAPKNFKLPLGQLNQAGPEFWVFARKELVGRTAKITPKEETYFKEVAHCAKPGELHPEETVLQVQELIVDGHSLRVGDSLPNLQH